MRFDSFKILETDTPDVVVGKIQKVMDKYANVRFEKVAYEANDGATTYLVLGNGTTYEPKKATRFVVEFPEEFKIPTYCVQKIEKPEIVFGKWQDIEIEFIDLIEPSTSEAIYNVYNKFKDIKCDYKNPKEIFRFKILALDPVGIVVETWTITVEEIPSVDFGDNNYGTDDIAKIKMVVRVLDCILK